MRNLLKPLKTKKGRDETGLFLIEGEKFVQEIPVSWKIQQYVFANRFAQERDLTQYKRRAHCEIVKDSIFDSLADTVSPQGILAVVEKFEHKPEDVLTPGGFVLLGENLNDPGNIGALVRTAAAAGAGGLILTEGSGDIYNPKVLRAAAGAVLRLPIVVNITLAHAAVTLKKRNFAVYAAHVRGDVLPYDLDLRENVCFMVGNESHGLTDEAINLADALVHLPMKNATESLNASVAGSILLYEAVRQNQISKCS